MFFALQLDRGNIQQALAGNLLKDLNLDTNDYNLGQTIFFVAFLCAELPSQLISKTVGVENWIAVQMICWSLVASFQAMLSGKTSFLICRCLLGLIEGGFIPDTVLYLSYWYNTAELPRRLAYFYTAYQSTNIAGALLSFAILNMNGIAGMEGWRWLFLLEGILTGLIGIATWCYLPSSPTQTASRPFSRHKPWFTPYEERIIVNRILRDDPSKGDMPFRRGLTLPDLTSCLRDHHLWPIYLVAATWLVPAIPMGGYLTLQLRQIGFSPLQTSLLSIPAYALYILQLLVWTLLSERLDERFLLSLATQAWCLPLLIALATMGAGPHAQPWIVWALGTLLFAPPYFHAVFIGLTSRNAGSVRTRTVASALYNMLHQAGAIMGSNIYREGDRPLYRTGNRALIGIVCYNVVLLVGVKVFYVHVVRTREARWDAMTTAKRSEYLATTRDEGNKRLDFRFAH